MAQEDLDEMENQLKNLEVQMIVAKIPEEIRRVLLNLIGILLTAIRSYRIRGKDAFHESVRQLVAAIAIDQETFDRAKNDEETRQATEIIRTIAYRIWTVASVASNVPAIVDLMQRLLLG